MERSDVSSASASGLPFPLAPPSSVAPKPPVLAPGVHQSPTVMHTTETTGRTAADPIREGGESSTAFVGEPPKARPPRPPLFESTAPPGQVFDRMSTAAKTVAGVEKENASQATTPDEIAYEEYALSQVHQQINDGLASTGLGPLYVDENRGKILGHDVLFLSDRIIITDINDPNEAQAFVAKLQTAAAKADSASSDPAVQLLVKHKKVIAELQAQTAQRLPGEKAAKARQAADQATKAFFEAATRVAEGLSFRCHPDVLGAIDAFRESRAARAALPPGEAAVPPPQQRHVWTVDQQQAMKAMDWSFRHLISRQNKREPSTAQDRPQVAAQAVPLPVVNPPAEIPISPAGDLHPKDEVSIAPPSPATTDSQQLVDGLHSIVAKGNPQATFEALQAWIVGAEKISAPDEQLTQCLAFAKTLNQFFEQQQLIVEGTFSTNEERQQALDAASEKSNDIILALPALFLPSEETPIPISSFYLPGYQAKCEELQQALAKEAEEAPAGLPPGEEQAAEPPAEPLQDLPSPTGDAPRPPAFPSPQAALAGLRDALKAGKQGDRQQEAFHEWRGKTAGMRWTPAVESAAQGLLAYTMAQDALIEEMNKPEPRNISSVKILVEAVDLRRQEMEQALHQAFGQPLPDDLSLPSFDLDQFTPSRQAAQKLLEEQAAAMEAEREIQAQKLGNFLTQNERGKQFQKLLARADNLITQDQYRTFCADMERWYTAAGEEEARPNSPLQQCRTLALEMFSFLKDQEQVIEAVAANQANPSLDQSGIEAANSWIMLAGTHAQDTKKALAKFQSIGGAVGLTLQKLSIPEYTSAVEQAKNMQAKPQKLGPPPKRSIFRRILGQ